MIIVRDIITLYTQTQIKIDFYSLRQNEMNSSRCIPLKREF